MTMLFHCRNCKAKLRHTFIDLGSTPLANSYVSEKKIGNPDHAYPLHVRVCENCFLVQAQDVAHPEEIFSEYAYFSSFSGHWVAHARRYAEMMISRFRLGADSRVVEVASNDGYLLQHFARMGVPVLGIEPAANVARAAEAKGIPTDITFFGVETARRLAQEGKSADLLVSNNVLAHVPDINDFTGGFAALLKPRGIWTVEFPHLLNLIKLAQFDTIYHEHYSYLSLFTVERILSAHGLHAFDVEEVPTHGGSLRVFICRADNDLAEQPGLAVVRSKEAAFGIDRITAYEGFAPRVAAIRDQLLAFLRQAKAAGKKVVAFGAAAKGNTLLNYCGITTDLISFVADSSTEKQGRYLPGSRLPIVAPEEVLKAKADYVVILPWNLRDEIAAQIHGIRAWGGKFIVAVPALEVF